MRLGSFGCTQYLSGGKLKLAKLAVVHRMRRKGIQAALKAFGNVVRGMDEKDCEDEDEKENE